MRIFIWILSIVAATYAPLGVAETLYIGDTLRVGVRSAQSDNSASLAVITTGAEIEVLERKGNHMKVRTSNGVEGWIKSAYVTQEKPAILLLKETQKQLAALRSEGTGSAPAPLAAPVTEVQNPALKQALADARREIQQLRTQLQDNHAAASTAVATSKPQPSPFEPGVPNTRAIALYVTGGVVLCFALGFLIGVSWHRGQVSKRLGGFSL
ncbi:MAG: TIGR04211 family SH3 domain-containing protein [Pseudomonadota bacterium]